MLWLSRVSIFNIWTLMVCGLLSSAVAAQSVYPNLPIRLITGYATGGTTTVIARLVGQKLTEAWGEQVVIDKLATLISGFVAQADFQAVLVQQGLVPHVSTPKQYAD